jgi:hypothetical protein
MDMLSHALWGYAVLRWRGPRSARWGALTGAAPDLLFGIGRLAERVATHGWSKLSTTFASRDVYLKDGPPMPPDLIVAYHHFYVYTHSFVILGLLGLVWYLIRLRPPWLLLPWALHIAMDIPTHERYQTPFLFPLSGWTIEGWSWTHPPVFLGNWAALMATYGLLWVLYWRKGRRRQKPWPEDVSGVA